MDEDTGLKDLPSRECRRLEQVDEFVKLKRNVTRTMVDNIRRGGGTAPDHSELQDY